MLTKLTRLRAPAFICLLGFAAIVVTACGCSHTTSTTGPTPPGGGRSAVESASKEFLGQKTFDPWVLTTTDPNGTVPAYVGDGATGSCYDRDGQRTTLITAGTYTAGAIAIQGSEEMNPSDVSPYKQSLDLRTGILTTNGAALSTSSADLASFWSKSDIVIEGDPEAQQVTHANMYYLRSSIAPDSDTSIPPFGLSSNLYGGHIFWDAEIFMFPALIAQQPERAKSIIDYRFKRLAQAEANAKAHGYKGAEYPWESADTGREEAPAEFAAERHITADVAWAAWQYYLWTGDKDYLAKECQPILNATADYWRTRIKNGHITGVLSPDETAGQVDDDAWTNSIVSYNLYAEYVSSGTTGLKPGEGMEIGAAGMDEISMPYNLAAKRYDEHANAAPNMQAKQADTQMLIYPLNVPMTAEVAANTLDYCLAHTIATGPAMTSSINAIIAARLGRAQQSLDLFRDSYRPFERSGLDAFSEKRTTNRCYFCTGMGGCLQVVLYGFGGLNVAGPGDHGLGAKLAESGDAALYADPHLPPGWTSLTIHGVKFRGGTYTLTVGAGNKPVLTKDA